MSNFILAALALNLIGNPDLAQDDGLGDPVGWGEYVQRTDNPDVAIRARALGEGAFELLFVGEERMWYLQRGLTFLPGARYRVSAEVKTFGLNGAELFFWIWDHGWHKDCRGDLFPDDTKDSWKPVVYEFTAPANANVSNYTFSVCGIAHEAKTARVQLRNLRLEALSQDAESASAPPPAENFQKLKTRIVPVDPLLSSISPVTGEMTFYWGGLYAAPGAKLEATFLGKKAEASFDSKTSRATVAFGRLRAGQVGSLVACVRAPDGEILLKNAYAARVAAGVKPGPCGKRLNNFVTELVRQPLVNGKVDFYRPDDGWVWISFDGDVGQSARGYLDGCAAAVVRPRDGEWRLETQRYVTAGWHTLEVEGARDGGSLRINAVKRLCGKPARFDRRGERQDLTLSYRYGLDFLRRFDAISIFNTCIVSKRPQSLLDTTRFYGDFYRERGYQVYGAVHLPSADPRRMDGEALYCVLTNSPWSDGCHLAVDENQLVIQRRCAINYAEAVWRMYEQHPELQVGTYLADSSFGAYYHDAQNGASEISAVVNSGWGQGQLYAELYAPTYADEAASMRYVDLYANLLRTTYEMVPAARGKINLWMASYIKNGFWNSYTSPQADIKVHYAKMMQAFATRPDFADNGGLSFSGDTCGEDEIRRWCFRCFRYYALEGGTDDLSERYGYKWQPGFVKNNDFDHGLTNWTVSVAKGGAIEVEPVKRLALIQNRKIVPPDICHSIAVFTTSEEGPNELSQEVNGLEPGKYYSLQYTTFDYDSIRNRTDERRPVCLSGSMDGAEEIKGLAVRQATWGPAQPKKEKKKVQMQNVRQVFKASATSARLVFRDRDTAGKALPAGTKQGLNYVIFRPFYIEAEGDIQDLLKTL